MSYAFFLRSLESVRDRDGHVGCYRDDAIRSFAQDSFLALLAHRPMIETTRQDHQIFRVGDLSALLAAGTVPDFSESDLVVGKRKFDAAYANAIERCNQFQLQKYAVDSNTCAARVCASAEALGIDLSNISLSILRDPAHHILAKEVETFKASSVAFAKLLAFDMARHNDPNFFESSISLIDAQANRVIGCLRAMRIDAKNSPAFSTPE